MIFRISVNEGKKFSSLSGDTNQIHLDDLTGYNSIFGEKICHGCLVILKVFKIIKLNKIINDINEYSIKIIFFKHFSYNSNIEIRFNKKLNLIKIFQKNILRAELKIEKKNNLSNINLKSKKHIININKKSSYYFYKKNQTYVLNVILNSLSKYVGVIYPGKNSIIKGININFNKKFNFTQKKMTFFSDKLDSRFPLINNKVAFEKYIVEFQTLERPVLKQKKIKIETKIKKLLKNINNNILIIGASTGVGYELLNIFKNNNKIKIIATYNKNRILIKKKNIQVKKIDLNTSASMFELERIIKKNKHLSIYYFATPKIDINSKTKNDYKMYENFYINYPLKILSYAKNLRIKFFYPSTIFVNNSQSYYADAKKRAEKIMKKLKNKNHNINILRIDEVNTKQNLSLFNKNLPSFLNLLNYNKNYQEKVFFTNVE